MENNNELSTAGTVPDKDSGNIISHAFELYKGTLLYSIIVGVLFITICVFLLGATGFWSLILELGKQNQLNGYNPEMYKEFLNGSEVISFGGGIYLINILLFSPLVVGIIYISHKKNINQDISISDLFIGFRQNFVNIIFYGLIFNLATYLTTYYFYFPAIFLMPFLFFGFPFLLFQNSSAIDSLKKSFDLVKNNYSSILVINLLAYICSLLGVLACCIGLLITYMFYYSTMYSAYCAYVGLPNQIKQTDL